MDERDLLAEQFEQHRAHLRAVAWRMLGSASDAEDAVQDAWLRLSRSDVSTVHDLRAWLTTVVGRVCLDALRARRSRREEPLTEAAPEADGPASPGSDPAQEAQLAESVGLALLVVLDTLEPAERLAFVLHDIFAVPYAQIAPLVERSTAATKMLASRARHRVRQAETIGSTDTARQTSVVRAFLAASRNGEFDALLELLDHNVVFRADTAAVQAGSPVTLAGAAQVARQFAGRARAARPALIDGTAGAIWMRGRTPAGAFLFTLSGGRISRIELIAAADRLTQLDLTLLPTDRRTAPSGRAPRD